MQIVSDAGPILSFARSGLLELLRRVVRQLIIPTAVHGSLRILKESKERSFIRALRPGWTTWYVVEHISWGLYREFLRQVGESDN